eukprot:COSAG02_NODE_7032_length_3218_cov_1.693171_4_plen_178_part_00
MHPVLREPDQFTCCGACDQNPECVTTVYVFGGCYLFNKAAIGQSYSRPGHGVSCQTKNFTESDATVYHQPVEPFSAMVTGAVLSKNLLALTAPGQFILPPATVTASIADDGSITLEASATAVFVWLSTLAQGRFTQNGIVLRPGATTIKFVPVGALDLQTLKASLRVEHLQQHLNQP